MARPAVKREIVEQEIFERHNGTIVMLTFENSSLPAWFKCLICTYEWQQKPTNVANRSGCHQCQINKDKLSYEYVQLFIQNKDCELLSKNYVNAREKLTIKFECGHIGDVNFNEFQQGKRCTPCGIKQRSNSHRTKESRIIQFLEDNNFKFLSFPNGFIKQKISIVEYECELGHITLRTCDNLFHNPTCNKCEFLELAELHKGKNNFWWKGGVIEIRSFASNQIKRWKRDSMESCNYKCVITGEKFDHVHHLYSFSNIIFEALDNLDLPIFENISQYSENEINLFANEIVRLHYYYPLGVCLSETVHKIFHKNYGRGNNTPEQFYEFIDRINSGEIIIPN